MLFNELLSAHEAMTRIALFGGSFNPPHIGHQMACLYVLETSSCKELWMVPTFRHPFDKALAPFEDRFEMCRRASLPILVFNYKAEGAIEKAIAGHPIGTIVSG